eukprot:TRINITY_DN69094_c0_g1_i1.p1 TRINITY_DN69094_c0_g1~~TRINITY_DN69094_c0_g1_i1.p1  ORF type:complete len:165 (+),score=36.46 TRINITY_DN69094_c0_g1_i1:63-557(+)
MAIRQYILCALSLLQCATAGPAFVSLGLQRPRIEDFASSVVRPQPQLRSGSAASSSSFGIMPLAAAVVGAFLVAAARHTRTQRSEDVVAMTAHRKPTKKGRRIIVLECTEQRQMVRDGVPGAAGPRGGVSRYYSEKNVRNTPELLELKKYNKFLGRHTVHKELK